MWAAMIYWGYLFFEIAPALVLDSQNKDFRPSKYFIESLTTNSIGLFYKRDTSKFYSVSSNVKGEKIMRLIFQCNFVFLLKSQLLYFHQITRNQKEND